MRLLVAMLLFLAHGTVAAGTLPADSTAKRPHHGESLKQCVECHQNADNREFRATMIKECMECHAENRSRGSLQQASQRSVAEVKPQKASGPAGMALPQYYGQTRIGKKPNAMVRVPAGAFTMGSNVRLSDEGPQHKVSLRAFWIDKYEVTNLQYKQFIAATGRHSPQHFQNRTYPKGKVDHPVTYVSWHDAKAYCEWAGKRLPSDAEWEKAARGTDRRTFPWGDEFDINNANTPVRWKSLGQDGDTSPVGAFPGGLSPYGVHDMSGNVWEWTDSWYKQYPGNKRPSENYGEQYKTLKGGSWWDCSFYQCGISAPVYNRSFFDPQTKNSSFGFRCAKDD